MQNAAGSPTKSASPQEGQFFNKFKERQKLISFSTLVCLCGYPVQFSGKCVKIGLCFETYVSCVLQHCTANLRSVSLRQK